MADFNHRPHKRRRRNSLPQRVEDDEIIPPPFKWATNIPAIVHTLNYLRDNNIRFICGEVQCKRCNARYKIHHNLQRKFSEIRSFIIENVESFNQRAPKEWMNPKLPDRKECKKVDSMKPVISPEKSSINWLFLLLGNLLGCCTLEQLKYFCKHTQQHRTGAKDRVLFAVYVTLCKQLCSIHLSLRSFKDAMADFNHRPHKRRRCSSPQRVEDDEIIPPPFKWATNRSVIVHTLNLYLRDNNIRFICGEVQCKRCNARYKIYHHLQRKFSEIIMSALALY